MKRMVKYVVAAAGLAALLGIGTQISSAATLSGAVLFSTDSSGNFYNGSVWNTRGGDTAVDLWVIRGTNLYGAFVNGPLDSQAGISIPLTPGEHTFVVYGNQGGFTPHHGLNLFFNGTNSAPRISVFGPTQTSAAPPYPPFAASGGSTLTLAFAPVAGANTLIYQEGTTRVELTDYRFADFNVYNIDRVSQRSTSPDGGADFIGQFTLRVTGDNPPPPPPAVFDLSRDFSVTSNPAGAWGYGWAGALDGSFNAFPVVHSGPSQNGVIVTFWAKNTYEPAVVYINNSSETSTSDNGQGVFPPGTVWFYAGPEGHPDNYSVIRFTAPATDDYKLETAVRSFLDGDRSGDTDFHILKNGTELFGQFLPPRSGTGYSNTLSLAAGDRIDFAIGRGQDGILYGSGLKIQARLERASAPPPPPPPPSPTYDLSRDFSTAANPNGAWSYGWLITLNGAFGLLSYQYNFSADNGVPLASWLLSSTQLPIVAKNVGAATARSDGDHFTAPPGTVYFSPGQDNSPQNYGVIRFTVPAGADGDYRIETAVQSLFDGTRSRDADFHVVKNGQELFGQFLLPNSGTSYSNVVHLSAGNTVDFAVGKGADGLTADTGLKIQASLTRLEGPPPPPPPPGIITLSGLIEFSTDSTGRFFNGSVWNTRGGDTAVNLWVIRGSDPRGPFINGPADSQAGISIGLAEGEQTFTIFGNRGGPTPHHGLNLFFNGDNNSPRISVFGPTQASPNPPFPPFSADGSSQTLTLAFQPVPGANTLVFQEGDVQVELINYRWADPSVYNIDRVSQPVATPDGTTDFIGQFTLRVSKVPVVPTIPRLTGLLEFSTDANGNFFNGSVWNTRGGDTAVNLWVAKGTDLRAPFVNGPSDAQAGINLQLEPGVNEFVIYGNQGGPTPHHGLNLFFNGNNVNPAISVLGPTQNSPNPPFPPFAANHSSNTLTLAFQRVAGAGTLVYQQGDVRVELTNYRWADPFVYNIDRVSQPVATPDGGPDFIGRFTLVVRAGPGGPPMPHIDLSPRLDFPGAPHALVVTCGGGAANIVLDARGSTDPDGDALSYAWFAGSAQPFSREAVVHTMADVGLHTVTLRVSDAQSSATTSLTFEVISPAEAVAQLSLMLEAADLSRKNKGPLQSSLNGAIQSLEHGKFQAAINQLGAFDNKVKAQLAGEHAELTEQLSAVTQALIAVLEDCAQRPGNGDGGGN